MNAKSTRLSRLLVACVLPATLWAPLHGSAATQGREAQSSAALRVCADRNNLPFSNQTGDGFENRIAELIAAELDLPVQYYWWPQTTGFLRNTLQARRCDLVMGIASGNERVQNTNPYYRSVYTMVYRKDSGITSTALSDPALKDLRFGVVAGTPPATLLARYGLIGQARPYHRNVDTRHFSPARQAIQDVASGETDVALAWGPIAGYFAARQSVDLQVVPLLDEPRDVRLEFLISMAVRRNEPEWKRTLNGILRTLKPRIDEVLAEYSVPMLDQKGQLITVATE
jgi:quinoprotein dehydrogenase-associated probable ABC transporter substrate-binding protein